MARINVIGDKSKKFALRIIKLYCFLRDRKREYVMARQILKSGTSIGANVREGIRGQSKPDFYSKLGIALKEAEETKYWLELLVEGGFITKKSFESIYSDCCEIVSILTAICKKRDVK